MRFLLILILFVFSGCHSFARSQAPRKVEQAPVKTVSPPAPVVPTTPVGPVTISHLSWEKDHPERLQWTNQTIKLLDTKYFDLFDGAEDAKTICPKYKSLNRNQRIHVWAEFLSAMGKFESAWKPETLTRECRKASCKYKGGCKYVPPHGFCMKGGHKLDGGIVISRGLFQISLESGQGYGCDLATPNDLHVPEKNIACAFQIFTKMIPKKNKVIFGAGHYWAVIKEDSEYNQIPAIIGMVRKTGLCE